MCMDEHVLHMQGTHPYLHAVLLGAQALVHAASPASMAHHNGDGWLQVQAGSCVVGQNGTANNGLVNQGITVRRFMYVPADTL